MYLLNLQSQGAVRLRKFINLVKNEYTKMFSKVSTWVLIGMMLIVSVGCSVLALIGEHTVNTYLGGRTDSECVEYYKSEIDYLKEVKTENWEQEAEKYQYKLDNKIYEDDWRNEACYLYFDSKNDTSVPQDIINEMDNGIKNNDWKKFFESALSLSDRLSEADKNIYRYCIDNNVSPSSDNWKYSVVSSLENAKASLAEMDNAKENGGEVDTLQYEELSKEVQLYQYRLDKNVSYDISENYSWMETSKFDFWNVFGSSTAVVSIIGVIIIIISGGIVSSEFSTGTIKFLLINPVKRWKILASKYFTSISFGYVLIFAAYLITMLATMVMFGADNLSASYLSISGDTVTSISGFLYVFLQFMLSSVEMIVMATLAFAISSLARSSALAIGVSVMAYVGGNTIVLFLQQLNFDWGRYLIFSNLSLADTLSGSTGFAGQTIMFNLVVIAVHMVVFILTAWDGFIRREV